MEGAGVPAEVQFTRGTLPPALLLNMEVSLITFNEAVLTLACDPRVPLLERVRFLSILGSNLDEFFMTRVAGFQKQVAQGTTKRTLDGLTPEAQLAVIHERVKVLLAHAYRALREELLPALAEHGIGIPGWTELNRRERAYLADYYGTQLQAVLVPRSVTPGFPFPHIRNLRPALAVRGTDLADGTPSLLVIPLPVDLPRFVPLPGGRRFIPLEELIRARLEALLGGRGQEVSDVHVFRVARSANFSINEKTQGDGLLHAVERELLRRPFQPVARLEVEASTPRELQQLLLRGLEHPAIPLGEDDLYLADGLLDLRALRQVASLPIPELHDPPLQRIAPVPGDSPFVEVLQQRDVLVHFPVDSFEATVERFLAEIAADPRVESLQITLYRTNRSSRIVRLLHRVRMAGKEVVAVIELKASFDERRNIEWARSLEAVGIRVVYGPPRLKVHAKIALVSRREEGVLRHYLYIGTGNLNAATAASYTDLGLFTADGVLGEDLRRVFQTLAGEAGEREFEQLLVAPFNMRERFLALIERETEHALAGRGGHIRAKLNGIADREMIAALYRASRAGVRVELVVRGICSLRPGVRGVSENIRVLRLVGRCLEHMRIFRFGNAGLPEYFIGSADWRPRNLSRRVEVVTPIHTPDDRERLERILANSWENPSAWELRADGSYAQVSQGRP